MRLRIEHVTDYTYEAPPVYALQQLRLTPKTRANQNVIDWAVNVDGGKLELSFDDQHMNHVDLISFFDGSHEVRVRCSGTVEVADTNGVIGQHQGFLPLWMFRRTTALTEPGPLIRELAATADADAESEPLTALHRLSGAIREAVSYEFGHTEVSSTAEQALTHGFGVCQDHAHIFVACARFRDIPARYVSGYLMMDDRIDQDATHAWAEAHVPDIGWVGFDVSNGISPDARYVRVATGLDYLEAAPVSGLHHGAGGEGLSVSVKVQQQQ